VVGGSEWNGRDRKGKARENKQPKGQMNRQKRTRGRREQDSSSNQASVGQAHPSSVNQFPHRLSASRPFQVDVLIWVRLVNPNTSQARFERWCMMGEKRVVLLSRIRVGGENVWTRIGFVRRMDS
jgi:hypothetical protein